MTVEPGCPRERDLREALAGLDTAYVGTIHSFADRLLRLRPVEADLSPSYEIVDDEETLIRPDFQRRGWIGRFDDDAEVADRVFQGRIEGGNGAWSVIGAEALGLDSLRRLRAAPDWPRDEQWRDGRSRWVPRKALAHAAITVLRPCDVTADPCGARLRWAVFLPLDNDPSPRPSTIVEQAGRNQDSGAWDIIMHGYFWPSHDRRSIPGVSDDDAGTGETAVRRRWNRAVCDELLLPLLPSALANALQGISEGAARSLLEAVADSRTVRDHLSSIVRRHLLLPVVTENGVRWEAHRADGARLLSIPRWTQAPRAVREQFAAELAGRTEGVVFIDDSAPRLGGGVGAWPLEWVESLLSCFSSGALRSLRDLKWTEALLSHLLGSPADTGDSRAGAVARWLTALIREGVLSATTQNTSSDAKAGMRDGWRRVFSTLPSSWLVDAPIATEDAVIELADAGAVGAGLLPVPLGRRVQLDPVARPDAARLDAALLELGTRLRDDGDTSQRARRSRLLLAEALLSVRETAPLGDELSQLPLLRARRLPADADEAWSIADLRYRAERHQVFASEDHDDDTLALDAPSDPKRAVAGLAEALGEPAWLVESSVAGTASVPLPTPAALALAVLSAEGIRSATAERLALLRRLTQPDGVGGPTDPTVRRAIVALLTGRIPAAGDDEELYFVRTRDSERVANRECLRILLRLVRGRE